MEGSDEAGQFARCCFLFQHAAFGRFVEGLLCGFEEVFGFGTCFRCFANRLYRRLVRAAHNGISLCALFGLAKRFFRLLFVGHIAVMKSKMDKSESVVSIRYADNIVNSAGG